MRYKVRDVFDDVTKYGTKIKTSQYLEHGKYPIFDQGKDYIAGYTNEDEGIFQKVPVILFGDHTGILKYITRPCFLGADGVKLLKPKDSNIVVKYLFYALNNVNIPDAGYSRHFKWLKEGEIPIPSKEQQSMIVEILDELSYIVQKEKEMLIKFDELVKSRFLEMFGNMIHVSSGFREMTLEEVCRKNGDVRCGPFGTQLSKSDYLDSGVPVWGIPEINSGFQIRASDYISKEKANLLSLYSIISGDIVMSRKGNVGKCEIYPSGYPVGIMHSDVLRIRVNKDLVNPTFLKYQFHFSERIKHQIDIVSHGAIMAGINVTKLKNINVLLPAINRQNQFSEFIHQVDKSKYRGTISLHLLEDVSHML